MGMVPTMGSTGIVPVTAGLEAGAPMVDVDCESLEAGFAASLTLPPMLGPEHLTLLDDLTEVPDTLVFAKCDGKIVDCGGASEGRANPVEGGGLVA